VLTISSLTRDENTKTSIGAVDSVSGAVEDLVKDATSDGLHIHIVGDDVGIGGGTQYTEGDTDATITGTAMMAEGAANTLKALTVDGSNYLNINIASDDVGIGGGTQYAVDAALGATPTGTLSIGIRDDALSALTPAEGDAVGLRVDATGALWVIPSGTVTVDGSGVTQPVSGTVTANLSATDNAVLDDIAASLSVLDDWDDTNYANVNINLAGTDVTAGAGAVAAGTPRVTLASNDPAVALLGTIDTDTGNIATSLGNLDNAVDGNYLNVNANIAGTDIVGGAGAVAAGVQRVTLASDDPAVAKLGTIDTDTGNMATSLGNLDNSVDGNYLNVNLNAAGTDVATNAGVLNAQTLRVTIATDDECNNFLGTIDADTGNIVTAVQIMDDWDNAASDGASVSGDVAHDGADAGEPVKIGGRAQSSEAQPDEVADNDRVDALFDRSGYLRVRGDFDPSYADINDASSGDNTIVAAQAAGKRIAVWAILVVSDGTTDVRFEDGAGGTAFTGQIPLQAREGFSISAGGIVPLFVGSAATLLNLELTAAVNVHGFVSYTVIDD